MSTSDPTLRMYNGNNFDFMDKESIDFILTDPPFNVSRKTNFHTYAKNTIHSYQFDSKMEETWDTWTHEEFLIQLDLWSKGWNRVLKKGGSFAVFCADAYLSHTMDALKANGLLPSRIFTWRKNNAVPINRKHMPMSANEYVITGVKKGKRTFNADVKITNQTLDEKITEATIVADKASTVLYSEIQKAVLELESSSDEQQHLSDIETLISDTVKASTDKITKRVLDIYKENDSEQKYLQACVPNYIQNPLKTGKRIHSTEKPVPLLQYFTALYSNEGDTILDSFSGSGSTGEAALSLGRNVVLVEQDREIFNASVARLTDLGFAPVLVDTQE